MLLTTSVAALLAVTAQAAATQTPQTDTTVAVTQGTRLHVKNVGGDIVVRAWDRNQVRIQASHSRRTSVVVERGGAVLSIESRASRGPSNMVDYQLTVPTWMALELGGMYAVVDIDGVRAPITVETLEGDVTVKGGAEQVKVTSVQGRISVQGATGRIEVNSVSEDVEIADVQGDVVVEGVSGDIMLRRVQARTVEIETVSGELVFDGRIVDGGRYSLLTHSGDITLSIAENTNATLNTAIGSGDVRATFALPTTDRPGRRRQSFRFGSGCATIEAETFSGDVRLIRPAELDSRLQQREEARRRARAAVKPKPEHDEHDAHPAGALFEPRS